MTDGPDGPESTHERLNRELARMRVRSVGWWGGWALLIGIVGLVALLNFAPRSVDYVRAEVTGITPLVLESGPAIQMGVTIDGEPRILQLPSQLVHPAVGETVCLRRTIVGGPLGRTLYDVTADRFCTPE